MARNMRPIISTMTSNANSHRQRLRITRRRAAGRETKSTAKRRLQAATKTTATILRTEEIEEKPLQRNPPMLGNGPAEQKHLPEYLPVDVNQQPPRQVHTAQVIWHSFCLFIVHLILMFPMSADYSAAIWMKRRVGSWNFLDHCEVASGPVEDMMPGQRDATFSWQSRNPRQSISLPNTVRGRQFYGRSTTLTGSPYQHVAASGLGHVCRQADTWRQSRLLSPKRR